MKHPQVHTSRRPKRLDEMFSSDEMIEKIWEAEGNIEKAANLLGCHYTSLYAQLKIDLDLAKERKLARDFYIKKKVAQREELLLDRQEQKKNLPVSLSAIKYFLDTHGKEEGWGELVSEKDKHEFDGELAKVLDAIQQRGEEEINAHRESE